MYALIQYLTYHFSQFGPGMFHHPSHLIRRLQGVFAYLFPDICPVDVVVVAGPVQQLLVHFAV